MSWTTTIDTHFPGAVTIDNYVEQTARVANGLGFSAENTIACVGVCRDELTRPFTAAVQRQWGEAFNFSSLGGIPTLGKTGLSAAIHHAPIEGGKERYVFFAMPHIAVDAQGIIGQCKRDGREDDSPTCGALSAAIQALEAGDVDQTLDVDDLEQSWLVQRLAAALPFGELPDLVGLTKLAADVIAADLQQLIDAVVNEAKSNYVLLTGVQIHTPDSELIWPTGGLALVGGKRQPLGM